MNAAAPDARAVLRGVQSSPQHCSAVGTIIKTLKGVCSYLLFCERNQRWVVYEVTLYRPT